MRWTPESLARASRGALVQAGDREISTAFIDSRAPVRDALFVPVVAARDGHDFILAATQGGASAVLCAKGRPCPPLCELRGITVVEVDDTLAALTELGRNARSWIRGPVVAITGSNGKTTTRAMVQAVLESAYERVLCTRGNLNNHLGVPLSLLAEPHEPDAAVLELGMSSLGENDHLAGIVRPTIGVITSIALEHLEFMGSLAAIAKAEAEIMAHVETGGALILPEGEPLLEAEIPADYRRSVLRCGPSPAADQRIIAVEVGLTTRATIVGKHTSEPVKLQLRTFGGHNVKNAASALAVASHLNLPLHRASEALSAVSPVGDRGRIFVADGRLIVADCYNANPGSMEVALESLCALRGTQDFGRGPRVAVLGDMLELGPQAEALHTKLGERAVELGVGVLVGFGPLGRYVVAGALQWALAHNTTVEAVHVLDSVSAAVHWLEPRAGEGSALLFKGSRGMAVERIMHAMVGEGRGHDRN